MKELFEPCRFFAQFFKNHIRTSKTSFVNEQLEKLEKPIIFFSFWRVEKEHHSLNQSERAQRNERASAIHMVVQQSRLTDGARKIMKITEITGMEGQVVTMQDIFTFEQKGYDKDGKVLGYHRPTGTIPKFVQELRQRGIPIDMSIFAT